MASFSLQAPSIDLEDSYRAYIAELGVEERYPFTLDFENNDFPALVGRLHAMAEGRQLPEGGVPNSTCWLVADGELVGVSSLRHMLNKQLERAGGHIGLGIRPSWRWRGASRVLLERTLDKAREMGINPVHIHCYEDNAASVAMIRGAGGELVDVAADVPGVMRFLISS